MDKASRMNPAFAENADASRAKQIVKRLFRGYEGGLAVRLWDGETLWFGRHPPESVLIFHHPRPLRELILFRDALRLAEAYFRAQISVEGSIYPVLEFKEHLLKLDLTPAEKASIVASALLLKDGDDVQESDIPSKWSKSFLGRWAHRHSRHVNREAIAFHYDVSNDFYRLWLDGQMVYSCAYFEDEGESLEQAQRNKLEHICRKLRLKPGERLLDIGCGWGALTRWAAVHHGVQAHGVTLSRKQYEHCLRKIEEQGLQQLVTVELKDYRDLEGEAVFDKVVSVGMFEHVGLKNLPIYFGTAHRLLKPGGLFLNHGITHEEDGWKKDVSSKFINRYVFPDGELDRVSNVQRIMEQSRFEILDVESLRAHYALTLRHWVKRLEERKEEALGYVNEAVFRVWRLYMASCALQFEDGDVGVHQILAAKRTKGLIPLPLTRRDLYS